jgi:predicted MFS family arabinose efflux permease
VPVYWKENLHFNETLIGVLLGLNGIIIALLEMMLVRYWEGRRHGLYYILRGVLLTAAGFVFLVLPLGMPLVTATIAVVLITFGEMMALPFINTLVISRANEHNRGRYSSAYAVTWAIALIVGPGGGGLVIERWGFFTLWIGVALLCVFCAWGIQVLYRRER